jgi:CubicO group peptidase (beta-lactamase class C family)
MRAVAGSPTRVLCAVGCLALFLAILAFAGSSSAEEPEPPKLIDSAAAAAFANEFFPHEMARRHIPGAVFVFVFGGEIAIARGFGWAQLEPRRAVDPDGTVFRLASVSKAITATAAMQLVEQKQIDLHTDVNRYLKSFQPAAAHGPITLDHLLTHTAGFDERLTGAAVRSANDLQPASRYLAQSMPPTFIEPGRVISYSNHGFALVGHLIEEVSGRPFADYVREQLFEPLGMRRSGSLTGRVPEDLAVAYEYDDGQHRALAPDYLQISSAGAFFTTGTDMGRFLIAHLRGGAYRDHRILQPETVAMMHARHFTQTPDTSGWAYGLWEDARDGQRALLHNGGGKGYRALMYLLPEQDAGFFVAYNLADRHEEGELQEVFITQFRKRFVPVRKSTSNHSDVVPSAEPFAGDYIYVRRARTTPEKMIAILNRVRIANGERGTLIMTGQPGGPIVLTPIGAMLFQRTDARGVIAFDAVADNRARRLVAITDSGFPAVYERIPLIATLRAQLTWLLGMILVFVYAAIWRPVAAVVRRTHGAGWNAARWTTWLAGVAAGLNLVFIVGFPLTFLGRLEGGVPEFLYGVPTLAAGLLLIPPITGMLSMGAVIAVAALWRDGRASLTARFTHSLVALALLSFIVFAWYWRLMSALEG